MSLRTAVGRGEKKKTTKKKKKKYCQVQSVQRSRGRWSCAALMFFFPSVFCWLFLMSCQCYFYLLGGSVQHIRVTVYRVYWLWARRLSAPWAALALRCPDGPFIPTSWEALTPSQLLKDALRAQVKALGTSVVSWTKFLLSLLPHFMVFFIAVSSIYLMAPPYEITQQEFLLYSNIWRLNNESCRHSFIKYKVALSAVQPWHFAEWCTICNVITQKMCCIGDNNCHLCLEYNALLSLSMTSQTHKKSVVIRKTWHRRVYSF